MQSFKKIYSVVMKLNQFFALHFFANGLYLGHVTNEKVRRKYQAAIAEYDELLTMVKKRKLRWFGHVSRSSGLERRSYRAQLKEREEEVDTRSDGMAILNSGQELTFPAQLGQLKKGQGGKGLLLSYLWCPEDLPLLWDKIK